VNAAHPIGSDDRHVVLVGLMGVGKTTVGQVLASRMGRQLVDSDFRIEQLTGRTVKQILAEDGVGELRRHEAAALFDALADSEPRVIAAAGGVVLDDGNRRRLAAAEADVVWLTGDVTTLAPRTATREHRPWLEADPVGTLQRMYVEREHLYREVADRVVDVDQLTPDEIADRILA
jgi:shikimate kinase